MLIAPAWKNQIDEFLNVLFDRFSCSKQQSCTNFQHQDQVYFFREISFLLQVSVKVLSFVCFSFCRNSQNEFFRRVSLLLGNFCYKQMLALLQNCKIDFEKKLMVQQGIKPGYSLALSDFARDLKFLRKIAHVS